MLRGRPKKHEIILSGLERKALSELSRSASAPHGLVTRAQIIIASSGGTPSVLIAQRLGVSMPTVGKWRRRFIQNGLAGLYDEHRPGCPRTHDDQKVANLLQTVLDKAPDHGTHWSVRSAAQATGISKSSVQRYSVCLKSCLNGACFLVLIFPVDYPVKGEANTVDQLIRGFGVKI